MTALHHPLPGAATIAVAPRTLQLGFLTPHNTLDQQAFSGTAFHAARALKQTPGVSCRLIGTHHRAPRPLDRFLRPRRAVAKITAAELRGLDMVVGLVATPLLHDLAQISDLPFLHVTDATPAFLRDTYGWATPESADVQEAFVARKAAACAYSSAYMAARARHDLALAGPRSIPFGLNLDAPATLPEKPSLARLNLLFVGADWARKGGDMAVAALDTIRLSGVDAQLTVAGNVPENVARHPHVTSVGFLNKNRAPDHALLTRLYKEAHLFLLPTRADCSPMVLAEAMAHGTPVIASDTGGVSEIVGRAGAGRVLPLAATAAGWADAIRALTDDPALWALASDTAYDRATTALTWATWAGEVADLARHCLTVNAPKLALTA